MSGISKKYAEKPIEEMKREFLHTTINSPAYFIKGAILDEALKGK